MTAAIVNHLWQSTLFAIAIATLMLFFRRDGAHVRYWLWWCASVKFLVPFEILVSLGRLLAIDTTTLPLPENWARTAELIVVPFVAAAPASPLLVALTAIWAAGSIAIASFWLRRILRLRRVIHRAWPAIVPTGGPLGRPSDLPPPDSVAATARYGIWILVSDARLEPGIVGILKPTLLVPAGIGARLTPAQYNAVVAHELAHLKRHDNVTAALQMVVETLFWFHPLVWWIGARLIDERERACDEAVVHAGHDRSIYAEGILNVCEHYVSSPLPCAAGISGSDLKTRVTEVMRYRAMTELKRIKKLVLLIAATGTVVAPLAAGLLMQRAAYAQAQDVQDEWLPIVRIAPVYPPRAVARGLEGYVIVEYTVTAQGSVQDAFVVESSATLFEQAALDSALKYKYQPRLDENGRAIAVRGVRTMIRFEMEQAI